MRKLIIERNSDSVYLRDISRSAAIFAKKGDKFRGMFVHEPCGWILRLGGSCDASGHWKTLEECINSCHGYGYEFYVE